MTPTEQAKALAKQFHEAYERLAPSFGYETRKASAGCGGVKIMGRCRLEAGGPR